MFLHPIFVTIRLFSPVDNIYMLVLLGVPIWGRVGVVDYFVLSLCHGKGVITDYCCPKI